MYLNANYYLKCVINVDNLTDEVIIDENVEQNLHQTQQSLVQIFTRKKERFKNINPVMLLSNIGFDNPN